MTPTPIPRARALEIIEGKLPELARLQKRPCGSHLLFSDASGDDYVRTTLEYALLPEREDALRCPNDAATFTLAVIPRPEPRHD
jgi:hypothetical protein